MRLGDASEPVDTAVGPWHAALDQQNGTLQQTTLYLPFGRTPGVGSALGACVTNFESWQPLIKRFVAESAP